MPRVGAGAPMVKSHHRPRLELELECGQQEAGLASPRALGQIIGTAVPTVTERASERAFTVCWAVN